MHLKKTNSIISLCSIFIFSFLFNSCSKKLEVYQTNSRVESFFKNNSVLSPQAEQLYKLLKRANEKSPFLDKLDDKTGSPIWEKIVITQSFDNVNKIASNGKSKFSESSTVGNNIIIPLTNDNAYLSSVAIGVLNSDTTISLKDITNEKNNIYPVALN